MLSKINRVLAHFFTFILLFLRHFEMYGKLRLMNKKNEKSIEENITQDKINEIIQLFDNNTIFVFLAYQNF